MKDLRLTPFSYRFMIGMLGGIGLALIYVAVAAIAIHFGDGQRQFANIGISFAQLVMVYVGLGALGGSIAGIMLPIARRPVGACLIGYIVALTVYGSVMLLLRPDLVADQPLQLFVILSILAAFTGSIAGLYLWHQARQSS